MPTDPPPLETSQLSWGYGSVLGSELALRVARGEAVVIVGPNGSGKSALLRTLCGLLQPLAGEVVLGGVSLTKLGPARRARRVALLPQQPVVDPELSVAELVELGRTPHLGSWGRLRAEDRSEVQRALQACDLQPLADRPLGRLSGGELQRAQLAMTLAQGAELLLLDEPTTHLDLRRRHELFSLLRRLRDEGLAVVLVLHELAEAFREGDRVLVLHQQRARELSRGDPKLRDQLAEVFAVPVDRIAL